MRPGRLATQATWWSGSPRLPRQLRPSE